MRVVPCIYTGDGALQLYVGQHNFHIATPISLILNDGLNTRAFTQTGTTTHIHTTLDLIRTSPWSPNSNAIFILLMWCLADPYRGHQKCCVLKSSIRSKFFE